MMSFPNPTFLIQLEFKKRQKREGRWRQERREERKCVRYWTERVGLMGPERGQALAKVAKQVQGHLPR